MPIQEATMLDLKPAEEVANPKLIFFTYRPTVANLNKKLTIGESSVRLGSFRQQKGIAY